MFSIICYFSIISVVFAFNMSIYIGSDYYSNVNKILVGKLKHKYNFIYQHNDKLLMDVILKNAAPDVTASVYINQHSISKKSGDTQMKNMTNCRGALCVSMRGIILNTPPVLIGLQLYQASTSCWADIFMEGNQVLYRPTSKDYSSCVEPVACVIEIDLQNACHGQNITSVTSDTPETSQNKSDTLNTVELKINGQNITSVTSDTPETSHNKSDTSNTVELKINDADIKKYITITIASVVSIIALILLVVVLRKRCWIKHNPIDSSQLPAHDPFYVNILFRKECDREIELVEQHFYEEINPQ